MIKSAELIRHLGLSALTGPLFHKQSNIYAELVMAMAFAEFADRGGIGRHRDAWQTLSGMMKVGIAMNEERDVGDALAHKRKSGPISQSEYHASRALEAVLHENYDQKKCLFLGNRPDLEKVVNIWENDAKLVSDARWDAQGRDIFEAVNLDSAVYTMGFLYAVAPNYLREFPYLEESDSYSDLRTKYARFVQDPKDYVDSEQSLLPFLSLHACTMAMKIEDDIQGNTIDKLLGIKGFPDFAHFLAMRNNSDSSYELHNLRDSYDQAASAFGWGLAQQGLRTLSKLRSVKLDPLERVPDINNQRELSQFTRKYSHTTSNLRENLYHAGILTGLLGR